MSRVNTNTTTSEWKHQLRTAKIAWGKLTNEELLKAEGRIENLVDLVHERYAIPHDKADKQVKSFFARQKTY